MTDRKSCRSFVRTERPTLSHDPGLPDPELLSLYRHMVLLRTIDEKAIALQRSGRIGFFVPSTGQEACSIGAGHAVREGDWIFPAYRDHGVGLMRGYPLASLIGQIARARDGRDAGAADAEPLVRPVHPPGVGLLPGGHAAPPCRRGGLRGEGARGAGRRAHHLRRRGDLHGGFPRGDELHRGLPAAGGLFLREQPVRHLPSRGAPDGHQDAVGEGRGVRPSRRPGRRQRRAGGPQGRSGTRWTARGPGRGAR